MSEPRLSPLLRLERPGDAPAIAALTTAAFAGNAHSAGTEAAIVATLRSAGALALSLLAEEEGTVVGHLALSPARVGEAGAGWYGLGPISVAPDRQRRGIGSALMGGALAWLAREGARGCVLVGEPAFYGRFSFAAYPALGCAGVPPQYVLALVLDGPPPAGDAGFHPAFFVEPSPAG